MITFKQFLKETTIRDKNGKTYEVKRTKEEDNRHHYTVHDKGKEVAHAYMNHSNEFVHDFGTAETHRRLGLQRALHDHIEKTTGKKLEKKAPYYTDSGAAFWKSRK